MDLRISDMAPLPLREQIVQQVRSLILSGELSEHSQLPSIRALAREHRVGVVTVQRAFEELERERMIYARQGKGYFVSPMTNAGKKSLAFAWAESALGRPLREAQDMGLTDSEIVTLVRRILDNRGRRP